MPASPRQERRRQNWSSDAMVEQTHSEVNDGRPWHERAEELASWTLKRLASRTDVHGCYREEGSYTSHVTLTHEILTGHYRAQVKSQVRGTHTTSLDNLCKWGGLDVDQHGEDVVTAELN